MAHFGMLVLDDRARGRSVRLELEVELRGSVPEADGVGEAILAIEPP